ncbi:rhomboid family intramembrane serine protease [Roseiconus nitratireducens]|uniref:Rhomboid family intramembrane serine protease n=1 Tax=Roseiconus nitratireducens TaxID=2605748 RepID=A0A5M6CY29_9BACT|nr:rhomboid family intramembrane serine protease [Roseiconus nitratireducens]KAA5539846.1 rhomboid family intramembrane serine protease [Roseiconus nitratireducens]
MIIPYSTDAPLYHWPIATASIIVANIAIFCATTVQLMLGNVEVESIEWLFLQFNQINPLQWLTCAFMHADIFHLLGNMFFLFAFGLIVEGKIGTARFTAVYFAICMAIGAIAQIPMFFLAGEGSVLGASGVVFGLMAIAIIWAPENELECFYLFFVAFGTFEARIISFGAFFIFLQLVDLILGGFSMSGAMGHMIGALVGAPIAFHMLRADTVDCEGWDVVSRNDWMKAYPFFYGAKQRQRDSEQHEEIHDPVGTALALGGGDASATRRLGVAMPVPAAAPAPPPARKSSPTVKPGRLKRGLRHKKKSQQTTPEEISARCQAHPEFNRLAYILRNSLQTRNLPAAQQAFLKIDELKIAAGLSEKTLLHYSQSLGAAKQWVNAIRPLAVVIDQQGPASDDACLRLAQIQLRVLRRPDQAILTLGKIQPPVDQAADAAKRQRLQKRDQLLALAQSSS